MKTLFAILFSLAILLIPGSHAVMADGPVSKAAATNAMEMGTGTADTESCLAACVDNQHDMVTAATNTERNPFLLLLLPVIFLAFVAHRLAPRVRPVLNRLARPPDLVLLHSRFLI